MRPEHGNRDFPVVTHDDILELFCSLYGICDAEDYWFAILDQNMIQDFGITPLKSNVAVNLMARKGSVIGETVTYVDDCLAIGNN